VPLSLDFSVRSEEQKTITTLLKPREVAKKVVEKKALSFLQISKLLDQELTNFLTGFPTHLLELGQNFLIFLHLI